MCPATSGYIIRCKRTSTQEANFCLSRALIDEEGRDKLPRIQVAKKAGISPDTLYAILRGERGGVGEETLRKLAETLAVPAPAVIRSLASEPAPAITPLAAVRLAQDALERARVLLDSTPIDPLTRETEALVEEDERNLGRGRSAGGERRRKKG